MPGASSEVVLPKAESGVMMVCVTAGVHMELINFFSALPTALAQITTTQVLFNSSLVAQAQLHAVLLSSTVTWEPH